MQVKDGVALFNLSDYLRNAHSAILDVPASTTKNFRHVTEALCMNLPADQTKLVVLHPKQHGRDFSFNRAPSVTYHDVFALGNEQLKKHLGAETNLHLYKYRDIIDPLVEQNADLQALCASYRVPSIPLMQIKTLLRDVCEIGRKHLLGVDDLPKLQALCSGHMFKNQWDRKLIDAALPLYPAILKEAEIQMRANQCKPAFDNHKVDYWDMVYWSVSYKLNFTQYDWVLVEHMDYLDPAVLSILNRSAKKHILAYGTLEENNPLEYPVYTLDSLDDLKRDGIQPIIIEDHALIKDSPLGETTDASEWDTEIDIQLPAIATPQTALVDMISNLTLSQTEALLKHFQLAINTLELHKQSLNTGVVIC